MHQNACFILYQSLPEKFYYELLNNKGELLLRMNAFSAKADCCLCIEKVTRLSVRDESFSRKLNDNDAYYFEMGDENGTMIGVSPVYASIIMRDRGIITVRQVVQTALVQDRTTLYYSTWVSLPEKSTGYE